MVKQKVQIIIGATILSLNALLFLINPVAVFAAACANPSNYGNATWNASIPDAGTYELWARVLVSSSSNDSFQLEIDGTNCWQMGGTAIPNNTWTWVNWHNSATTQTATHTFSSSGTHIVKIIGSAANVQVDKVILLGTTETCNDGSSSPVGNGDNCASAPAATSTPTTPSTTPTETVTVTGATTPDIVSQNEENAAQTSYVVNGQVIQTSDGAAALDTSKLEDGTYTIEAVVTLKDGTEVKQLYTITVDNNKSVFQKYKNYIYLGLAAFSLLFTVVLFVLLKQGKWHIRLPKIHSQQNRNSAPLQRPIIIKPNSQHR